MFDGAQDQFHQFIAPRTTLPLHLSFPLHASPTPTNTFIPFDLYNPSSHHHHLPLQTTLLHPTSSSPTHKHHEQHNKELPNTNNLEIQTDQRQLPELTDSWTNDEVLALLRIRSSMENWFPQLTWDHVSRRLAELGFKKSAEKCKEKFEDESRCFDNINNNYGKNNFRFLSELEELCQNPDSRGGAGDGVVSDHEKAHHVGGDNNMVHYKLEENSREIGTKQLCDDHESDNKVVEKSKEKKRKRRDRFEMFKGFCKRVVNRMMAQQEEIHNKLLEDMVKRDQEKFAREEAWKTQEMDRMNKELEIMAQEQAIAGDRHATIIEFLKKCATTITTTTTSLSSPPSQNAKHYQTNGSINPSPLHLQNPNNPSNEGNDNLIDPTPMILNHDQTTLGGENPSTSDTLLQQVPSSSNSSPAPHNPSSSLNSHNDNIIPLESNSVSTYKSTSSTPMVTSENSKEDVGRRWPRDEVLALINLRCTSLSNNNNSSDQEKEGNKGPLWERISQGMSELGYKRSAKRCKEKWENINKYFRKTKDVNKKRSLNSRTCPYFHQLSCLYDEGKIVAQSERDQGNPTANNDQVQVDESSQVGSGELVQYAC